MRLAAAVLLLLTTSALAQPGATPPGQPYGPPQPYSPPPQPSHPQPYAPQPYPQPYAPQPAYTPPQPMYAPAQPVAEHKRKDESTATWLAIGATAAGLGTILVAADDENEGLALAGLALTLIGPSAGHIYAGETGHAAKMTLLRTAGFATFMYGAIAQSSSSDCDYNYDCGGHDDDDGETAMWLGGALVVGATLYDFYDASRAARRTNRKHQPSWAVAPTMMSAQGQRSPGVALSGSF